jgi:glycerol uptake facilitator protein
MDQLREFVGEFVGTFLMVFFGVGVVTTTTIFGASTGPFQIALTWGVAIALAIYATRHLSNAHFNTAVSLAMVISGRMPAKKLPVYIIGQLLGAIAAAGLIFLLMGPSINEAVMAAGGWDSPSGISSVFLGVWPNNAQAVVSMPLACIVEMAGTFLLIVMIFSLTEGANLGRPDSNMAPLFIGLTVTALIVVLAPLTNAGINPARDLGPRIVGAIAGWGSFAFSWEIILVYVVAPLVGGLLAALVLMYGIEPLTSKGKAAEKADGDQKIANEDQSDVILPEVD